MTRPDIDIGRVGVWYGGIDALPFDEARRAAALVDELGFGALWVAEAVGRDPFVQAAALLEATERVVLATGIANIYARDPMTTNAAARTLNDAYDRRFLLGLGVSHAHLVSHLRKHDYSKPYSYMVEYLDRMDDSLFMAAGADETPPRVLAALGPKMLALSAEKANGAHPYFTTPDHTRTARETMGPDALLAPEQMVVLETDADEARRIAREAMAVYLRAPNYRNNLVRLGFDETDMDDGGSDRLVDAIVVWGTADDIARRVAEHHDAGADHVCVQLLGTGRHLDEARFRTLADALLD